MLRMTPPLAQGRLWDARSILKFNNLPLKGKALPRSFHLLQRFKKGIVVHLEQLFQFNQFFDANIVSSALNLRIYAPRHIISRNLQFSSNFLLRHMKAVPDISDILSSSFILPDFLHPSSPLNHSFCNETIAMLLILEDYSGRIAIHTLRPKKCSYFISKGGYP